MKNSKPKNQRPANAGPEGKNKTFPKKVKSKSTSKPTVEEMEALFIETDEMQAFFQFCDAVTKAGQQGAKTVEVPTAFIVPAIADIAIVPRSFTPNREAWNRLCDENAVPEMKEQEPGSDLEDKF
jgi:hypothetical protein